MNTIQEEQTASPEIEQPPLSYDEAKLERLVEAPPGLEYHQEEDETAE